MRKYVIMGVPGSGKSSQGSLLAADLDLVHISVGDIFRWNVQHHTKMGAQVRRIMAAGELVGDDLAEAVTAERLAQHDWNYGFVIDGFGPDGVSARVLDVTRNVVRLQTGYLYHYAFAMLIGVAAFITWFMFYGAH